MTHRLSTEAIAQKTPMRDFLTSQGYIAHFTSDVHLVTLSSGLQAILKMTSLREALAEVAAYKASRFLGLDFVPPTTLYATDEQCGVLQEYKQPAYDLCIKNNYQAALNRLDPEQRATILIFYFVFGQWDADASNMIVSAQDQNIYLIDNAAMCFDQKVKYGQHPFVKLFKVNSPIVQSEDLEHFPFDQVRILPANQEAVSQEFRDQMPQDQIRRLCALKKDIHYVIWQNHLWRQFRFGTPAYTTIYPAKIMNALNKMAHDDLHDMFSDAGKTPFSDHFFNDILERRDQVIHAYQTFNS